MLVNLFFICNITSIAFLVHIFLRKLLWERYAVAKKKGRARSQMRKFYSSFVTLLIQEVQATFICVQLGIYVSGG